MSETRTHQLPKSMALLCTGIVVSDSTMLGGWR